MSGGGAGSNFVSEEPAPFGSAADLMAPGGLVGNRLIDSPASMNFGPTPWEKPDPLQLAY